MYDIVTIGAATQDNYIQSSKLKFNTKNNQVIFPLGTKIEADHVLLEVGGGATNVAATCVRFGLSTSVVSKCGDDPSGAYVLSELNRLGVDTRHIAVQKGARTGYAVIFLTSAGERTIFVYRGVTEKNIIKPKDVSGIDTQWFYVSSLGGNVSSLRTIFEQKKRGINIAWNPGKEELRKNKELRTQLAQTDILLLNEEEAKIVSRTKRISKDAIRKITKNIVIVTLGDRGSRCFIGTSEIRVRVQKVIPKDTTGAGDAFGSGCLAGILTSRADIKHALFVGSANAMSVVSEVGAKHGLVSPHTLNSFRKRIHITS